MLGLKTFFKRFGSKFDSKTKFPFMVSEAQDIDGQIQTFLFELEKKLIRLEVSLRRVKEEPSTILTFLESFKRIIEEIEEAYTPEIETGLLTEPLLVADYHDYSEIITDFKVMSIKLAKNIENPKISIDIINLIQEKVILLLDSQLMHTNRKMIKMNLAPKGE